MTDRLPFRSDIPASAWHKSSYSAANNECVEVARARAWVAVRDSKAPDGPALAFPAAAFTAFVDEVRGASAGGRPV
ncbi:DUF397 domain-containing protein [Streptomyces lydicus]|uniref:DUF397 domain-containing protein n=1 Tax=Streptomyces lydicus TaxID=47763 RepID=UPI001011F094|nr:DUF397 domain-containing protein [Streptomyces lydicus]MCZ1009488.1 DUF397 domain-containing protein [Streptomyces lydicus]